MADTDRGRTVQEPAIADGRGISVGEADGVLGMSRTLLQKLLQVGEKLQLLVLQMSLLQHTFTRVV